MLVSHCGEYMANGLTNAVRHEFAMIANDRQTFVAVRKHSRSFLWCFECYAGLTSGECRVTWGMTASGGKTAPLPVDNLKLPRTFSE